MSYWFCNCTHKSTGITTLRLHNNLIIFIGQVFHAEKMLSKENVFHKKCFTCLECKRPLDSTLCNDSPDGEIFCRYSSSFRMGNLCLIRHYYKTNNANLSQNHFIILQIMLRQEFWSKRIWVRRGRFGARINVR